MNGLIVELLSLVRLLNDLVPNKFPNGSQNHFKNHRWLQWQTRKNQPKNWWHNQAKKTIYLRNKCVYIYMTAKICSIIIHDSTDKLGKISEIIGDIIIFQKIAFNIEIIATTESSSSKAWSISWLIWLIWAMLSVPQKYL